MSQNVRKLNLFETCYYKFYTWKVFFWLKCKKVLGHIIMHAFIWYVIYLKTNSYFIRDDYN